MQHHLFWVVFVAYFSFFNKCETKQQQAENGISYILSQIFENSKPPVILYLKSRQNDRSIKQSPVDLRQYANSIEENPEYLKQKERSIEENERNLRNIQYISNREEDSNENILRTIQTNERAYILYHLLRTTIEDEEIDPAIVQHLQPAKQFLRNAFIGRCKKLNKCLRQCPKPKKKYLCTVQCKQIFDDLDECDEPKENKCGVSKCGHTMPPSWLL